MTATSPRASRRDQQPVSSNPILRLYRGQTQFDFINRWRYWFAISGTIIVIGMVALGVRGLNFSIDFKGGVVWQVPTTQTVAEVRAELGKIDPILSQSQITQLTNHATGEKSIEVQAPGDITGKTTEINAVTDQLARTAKPEPIPTDQVSLNAIGPSWGSDITNKAIEAVVVFLVLISISIAIYFETKMAVAALVALLHDLLITVGIYALSGFQVSPDTVIAFLTVLGYSLYDTIVVFDKVKENTRGLASTNRVTYTDVVNLSMNQVLARSINTSFVAVMPVFCILVVGSWILGASALNDFGLALFIGLLSGAYSSIFIASPILAILKEREPRYVEIRKRLAAYPQSRQVLTASSVADGVLLGAKAGAGSTSPRPGSAASSRTSSASTTVVAASEVIPGPALPVGPAGLDPAYGDVDNGGALVTNGDLSDAGAEPAATNATSAGNGGSGAEGVAAAGAIAAAGAVAAVGAEAARDASGPATSTSANGGARPQTGARKAPPRPRKKTPRRR
jgi:preprotein translocase subunit SecF